MILLASAVVPGFHVDGFGPAFWGAVGAGAPGHADPGGRQGLQGARRPRRASLKAWRLRKSVYFGAPASAAVLSGWLAPLLAGLAIAAGFVAAFGCAGLASELALRRLSVPAASAGSRIAPAPENPPASACAPASRSLSPADSAPRAYKRPSLRLQPQKRWPLPQRLRIQLLSGRNVSRPRENPSACVARSQRRVHAIFQALGRGQAGNRAAESLPPGSTGSGVTRIVRIRIHRKLLVWSSRPAIRLRARNSRDRTLDSVMPRTEAISTLLNSSKAESISTCRSLAGSRSTQART